MGQGFTNKNKTALPSSGGASTLNDLTDVIITTPSNGQVVKYNGSSWVNDTDATGGGTDATKLAILNNLSDLNNVATAKTNLSLVKADVGLSNVDNTSDAGKPVSTATQTALDLKAPLASPTFTGTVGGITKSMVGLGSVVNSDTTTTANITDASNKRFVTDAQQTVINNTSGTNTGDNATNTQYSGLAASKEDVANKQTDLTASATKYPTVNAVNTGLGLKQNSLGFTAENVANKTIDFDAPSNTLYPTSLAVSSLVGSKQATLVSTTNIKSVNGVTILGAGDLLIQDVPLNIFTLAGNSTIATETVRVAYFKYNIATFKLTINGTGKLLILQ